MTIRGIIFDLGSTLMYFDGDWEDVIGQGVTDMIAFFKRKRVKLDERVDPAVLAGVRLQVGHKLIDGSAAGRLARMREQLMSERGRER